MVQSHINLESRCAFITTEEQPERLHRRTINTLKASVAAQ